MSSDKKRKVRVPERYSPKEIPVDDYDSSDYNSDVDGDSAEMEGDDEIDDGTIESEGENDDTMNSEDEDFIDDSDTTNTYEEQTGGEEDDEEAIDAYSADCILKILDGKIEHYFEKINENLTRIHNDVNSKIEEILERLKQNH